VDVSETKYVENSLFKMFLTEDKVFVG